VSQEWAKCLIRDLIQDGLFVDRLARVCVIEYLLIQLRLLADQAHSVIIVFDLIFQLISSRLYVLLKVALEKLDPFLLRVDLLVVQV